MCLSNGRDLFASFSVRAMVGEFDKGARSFDVGKSVCDGGMMMEMDGSEIYFAF